MVKRIIEKQQSNESPNGVSALLINPPIPSYWENKEYSIPPSLMYIASYAETFGFRAEILDMNLYTQKLDYMDQRQAFHLKVIRNKVESCQPQVIGIGCLFSGQFPFVDMVTNFLKIHWPTIITCTGGIHPTIFAQEILLNCPGIDFVCVGEGEEQFVEILRYGLDMTHEISCDGIGFRHEGEVVVRNKKTFHQNLDNLPFPAYHLINFDDYRHDLSHWHNPKEHFFDISIPLISSRSCPNRCNFCSMFLVMGPKFRARSAKNVVEEISYLNKKYGMKHFTFMDDNLTYSKKRTLGICNEISRRGLDIQFDTPNGLMVRTLDQEVINALVAAGWVRGSIAIESGSDFIRNSVIGKKLSEDKIFEVIDYIKNYPQVFLRAYFIMGFPEDTEETLIATYNMIKDMDIDETYVNNLLPFPGTKLFDQCVKDDLLIGFNTDTIWKADCLYGTGNKKFFLKPYALELEDLNRWRQKFDALLDQKKSEALYRRENRIKLLH